MKKIREQAQETPTPVQQRVFYHLERIRAVLACFTNRDLDQEFLIQEITEELRDVDTLFNNATVANPERLAVMEKQRAESAANTNSGVGI